MKTLFLLTSIVGIVTAIFVAIKYENFDVKKHQKRLIMTYCIIFILIVVGFIFCADDFLEKLLIFLLCGIVVPSAIGLLTKNSKKFSGPMGISGIIYLIIFFCFSAWNTDKQFDREISERGESLLEERKLQEEHNKEEARLAYESDSIKNEKIKYYSEKVKKEFGNKIFGNFFFGMSRKQYERELQNVKKELGGIIKIAGYDFHIYYPDFVDDKLYRICLMTDKKERESIEGTYEYSDGGYYAKMIKDITPIFIERYGDIVYVGKKDKFDDEWNLETIRVKMRIGYLNTTYSQGYMKIEDWGAAIEYTNPQLEQIVIEKEEKRKAAEQRKEEEKIRKQKELEDKQSNYF